MSFSVVCDLLPCMLGSLWIFSKICDAIKLSHCGLCLDVPGGHRVRSAVDASIRSPHCQRLVDVLFPDTYRPSIPTTFVGTCVP